MFHISGMEEDRNWNRMVCSFVNAGGNSATGGVGGSYAERFRRSVRQILKEGKRCIRL